MSGHLFTNIETNGSTGRITHDAVSAAGDSGISIIGASVVTRNGIVANRGRGLFLLGDRAEHLIAQNAIAGNVGEGLYLINELAARVLKNDIFGNDIRFTVTGIPFNCGLSNETGAPLAAPGNY